MYCSKSRRKGSVTIRSTARSGTPWPSGAAWSSGCGWQSATNTSAAPISRRSTCALARSAGVEVLMRWKDEDGIIQPPGELLKLAVGLGLTDDLTHLVIAETVQFIDRINEAFGRDCSISINVAAPQAANSEFMRSLIDRLDATGFAQRFILELTEEAFLPAGVFQTMVLPMIRSLGARVSIDDFGTGYSSLSALADITADEIKVDRSFISEIHRRPRSQTILRAIEAIGHSLGMTIVAEGIETFEELAYLQATTRIGLGQGFYFSKPLLLEELHEASNGSPLRTSAPSRERTDNRISRTAPPSFLEATSQKSARRTMRPVRAGWKDHSRAQGVTSVTAALVEVFCLSGKRLLPTQNFLIRLIWKSNWDSCAAKDTSPPPNGMAVRFTKGECTHEDHDPRRRDCPHPRCRRLPRRSPPTATRPSSPRAPTCSTVAPASSPTPRRTRRPTSSIASRFRNIGLRVKREPSRSSASFDPSRPARIDRARGTKLRDNSVHNFRPAYCDHGREKGEPGSLFFPSAPDQTAARRCWPMASWPGGGPVSIYAPLSSSDRRRLRRGGDPAWTR